jgi:Zn-dependent peptidase ImmA (M78 family)
MATGFRRQCNSWKQFLDEFIAKSEDAGILVFRSSLVGHATNRPLNVKEFRGFALSDLVAPVVFVNDNDAKAAQIFTVAHEVAHIWIGETGISDNRVKVRSSELANAIERFCNRVSAEVLVPEDEIKARWNSANSVRENVTALSAEYRVSSLVVLRRAYETGRINYDQFSPVFDAEEHRFRVQDRKEKAEEAQEGNKKQGGNFWASFVIRNSRHFTDMVVTSAREGRSRYTDAASVLGIQSATLDLYLQRLESSR